jgi:KTSC domain
MPSSVISSYNYNPDTENLTIRYVSGLVYCYQKVPEKVFKEFKTSISKGRYLNFYIKGKFDYHKIDN